MKSERLWINMEYPSVYEQLKNTVYSKNQFYVIYNNFKRQFIKEIKNNKLNYCLSIDEAKRFNNKETLLILQRLNYFTNNFERLELSE